MMGRRPDNLAQIDVRPVSIRTHSDSSPEVVSTHAAADGSGRLGPRELSCTALTGTAPGCRCGSGGGHRRPDQVRGADRPAQMPGLLSNGRFMYFAIFISAVIGFTVFLLVRIHTYNPERSRIPKVHRTPKAPVPEWKRARSWRRLRIVAGFVLGWSGVTFLLTMVSPTAAVWGGGAVVAAALATLPRVFDPARITDAEMDQVLANLLESEHH